MFFLIYLLIFVALIFASWTSIAKNQIGLTDVVPAIWESAKQTLDLKDGNGLSIIAMAFLLYVLLQSKSIQALFASKRKWLQKRRFVAVAIITITTSLLASTLWWADEFIHFYPLIVPFLLSMGFDVFSSVLCLYGGSIVGIIGSLRSEGHQFTFDKLVNPKVHTHFTGSEGSGFRAMVWLILTTILVFFNIWYCNKFQKKSAELPAINQSKPEEKIPTFNWKRKLILFLGFFFILTSILGSVGLFAEQTEKITDKIPKKICGTEEKVEYNDLGTIKVSPNSSPKKGGEKNENEMKIAQKETKEVSWWGKFGEWGNAQKVYWFFIGGIIICWIAKLNVINALVTTITKTAPIIIIYIFSHTVIVLLDRMKLDVKINFFPQNRLFALPVIFGVFFLLYFFSISVARALIPLMAGTLKSLSANTLAYSVTVTYMARFLASGVSPLEGNLQMSLQTTKLTYKEYIKKTWLLWTIIFFVCLILISLLPFFIDRGSG